MCPDYTHVIALGGNEPIRVLQAIARYTIGGTGYEDPVAFADVLEFVNEVPTPTFEPVIAVRESNRPVLLLL